MNRLEKTSLYQGMHYDLYCQRVRRQSGSQTLKPTDLLFTEKERTAILSGVEGSSFMVNQRMAQEINRLKSAGFTDKEVYRTLDENYFTMDYLNWMANVFGVSLREIHSVLNSLSFGENQLNDVLVSSNTSFSDVIRLSSVAHISPQSVAEFFGKKPYVLDALFDPTIFNRLIHKLRNIYFYGDVVDFSKHHPISIDNAALIVACQKADPTRIDMVNEIFNKQRGTLTWTESWQAAVSDEPIQVTRRLSGESKDFYADLFQPSVFPRYYPRSYDVSLANNMLFSSSLKGRVRFVAAEHLIGENHRVFIDDLISLANRAIDLDEKNQNRLRLFLEHAVFELLKNAFKSSMDGTAYFEWKIDIKTKRVIVRIINKSEGTFIPSQENMQMYKGWDWERIEADLKKRKSELEYDEWGGIGRGIALASALSDSLSFKSIKNSQGEDFGTAAIARLELDK